MTITQTLLEEFERELPVTRRFLERLPDDRLNWRPHEKSMTAGQLALHIAKVPGRVVTFAAAGHLDLGALGRPNPDPASTAEVLQALEESAATVRTTLAGLSDAQLAETWRATKDGAEMMAMPRLQVIRTILLNHWYHHRGQFGVYLRLLGAKVPAAYGPSGDEPPAFAR